MRSTASIIVAAALAVVPAPALAGDKQLWTTQTLNVKLSDKWRLQEDVVERFSDDKGGLYEIEANSLVGYRFSKTVTLWAGFTIDPQYSNGVLTTKERRLREQVTLDNVARLGAGRFSFRLRTEQRFRNNASGTGWRFRPYAKYAVPLDGKATTFLNISTEFFLNLNSTSFQSKSGLDRMRNQVSISKALAKHLTGELGYLNQHVFVRDGENKSDHVAMVTLSLSL